MVTLPSTTQSLGSVNGKTTWTLLLYLTSTAEGCLGGETVFYPWNRKVEKEAIVITPETGMLLLHKHGDDCLLVGGKTGMTPRYGTVITVGIGVIVRIIITIPLTVSIA